MHWDAEAEQGPVANSFVCIVGIVLVSLSLKPGASNTLHRKPPDITNLTRFYTLTLKTDAQSLGKAQQGPRAELPLPKKGTQREAAATNN